MMKSDESPIKGTWTIDKAKRFELEPWDSGEAIYCGREDTTFSYKGKEIHVYPGDKIDLETGKVIRADKSN